MLSKNEIAAAVAANPSLCASSRLIIPAADEAQAAFHKAKGETFPNVTITIGMCNKDTMGPGIAYMSRII